jgi:hypothetical protein
MDFAGLFFPGFRDDSLGRSQRSYSYDPAGSRSRQNAQGVEILPAQTDNITWRTIFGVYSPTPPVGEIGLSRGNLEQTKPIHQSRPDWFGGWWSNDWNELRAEGVGYAIYAPHLPLQPVPVWKLYEAGNVGSNFVLPATFLGQPLAPRQIAW